MPYDESKKVVACHECGAILEELAGALFESPGALKDAWLEQDITIQTESDVVRALELLESNHPGLVKTRQRKIEHEAETGHSIGINGWKFARFKNRLFSTN